MSTPVLVACNPAVVDRQNMPDVMFRCPGCKCSHGVWTSKAAANGARWKWNGDMIRPTFEPSILISIGNGPDAPRLVCHSFVREGKIQFLGDCTHELAGQTVPLPTID